jgi:hypothetical protein
MRTKRGYGEVGKYQASFRQISGKLAIAGAGCIYLERSISSPDIFFDLFLSGHGVSIS